MFLGLKIIIYVKYVYIVHISPGSNALILVNSVLPRLYGNMTTIMRTDCVS